MGKRELKTDTHFKMFEIAIAIINREGFRGYSDLRLKLTALYPENIDSLNTALKAVGRRRRIDVKNREARLYGDTLENLNKELYEQEVKAKQVVVAHA